MQQNGGKDINFIQIKRKCTLNYQLFDKNKIKYKNNLANTKLLKHKINIEIIC